MTLDGDDNDDDVSDTHTNQDDCGETVVDGDDNDDDDEDKSFRARLFRPLPHRRR